MTVYTKQNRAPREVIDGLRQEAKAKDYFGPNIDCPGCGAPPRDQQVRNYDRMWGDGDVYCTKCGSYVRMFDTG